MRKLTKIAAAVGSVLLVTYGSAAQADISSFTPSAYAESELNVSNFQFSYYPTGFPGPTSSLGNLVGSGLTISAASLTSTLSASVNNVPGTITGDPSGTIINPILGGKTVNSQDAAGPNAANYTPYASFGTGTLDSGVYAGSASNHSGNGLQLNGDGPTIATTQAIVNINKSAGQIGSADSRQTLGTTFVFTLTAPTVIDTTFDANAFLRVALGQDQVLANASREWQLTVRQGSTTVVKWTPDGNLNANDPTGSCTTGGSGGSRACFEFADGFDLNLGANTQTLDDLEYGTPTSPVTGSFGLRVGLLAGTYVLNVVHTTKADASTPEIPEPASLALLGLGLAGLGFTRRRKDQAS